MEIKHIVAPNPEPKRVDRNSIQNPENSDAIPTSQKSLNPETLKALEILSKSF